jgi:hypothetical protein
VTGRIEDKTESPSRRSWRLARPARVRSARQELSHSNLVSELTVQGSATDRTSTDIVVIHPLDPDDAAITAAMCTMASSAKGVPQGIEARGQFDVLTESVLPRDDVTFEADTLGGIWGFWVFIP